jgi:tetratricopeptide (TPR) repeat protein
MSEDFTRFPLIDCLYHRYLGDENSAAFIHSISQVYNIGSLERLARYGQAITRRASILAIGFLGDFASNEAMGRALVDPDRGVRMLADHGIRQIWMRQGSASEQGSIKRLHWLSTRHQMDQLIVEATMLIEANPLLAEAWNQRAIGFCAEGDLDAAVEDCKETLNCNRFHFPAAIGLAHCCLQINDASAALESFRLALDINPDLEGVRRHIRHLEKSVRED